ncbi:MAG: secretion protein, partial [Oscillospiraceae bacterium]|nr:secretion protein [Oscillospiraceae bacterium]
CFQKPSNNYCPDGNCFQKPTDNNCPGGNCNVTTPGNTDTSSSTVSDYEKKVVELVNEIRAEYGLSALKLNTELSSVARAKSQDMKDKNYFSHTSPTYGSPFDMMKTFGISYRTAGENIAMGYSTPEKVVDAWMNSEGHRANILNSSYKEIGVGYVSGGNYWTQMFIG